MKERLLTFPLILILAGVAALAMMIPGLHALVQEEHRVARAFVYSIWAFHHAQSRR